MPAASFVVTVGAKGGRATVRIAERLFQRSASKLCPIHECALTAPKRLKETPDVSSPTR
jgi:hypothetical protein